jgi:hypothetical protein
VGHPVVVLVVRKTRFDNTNAVLDDFVELLQDNQEACEKHLIGDVTTDRRAVVLLARNTLNFSQISSPVTLPAWFPGLGGRLATVIIEDLTWHAACPLNAEEAAVDQLCQLLFSLEGALLERLRPVHARNKSETASFWDQVKRDKDTHGSVVRLPGGRTTRTTRGAQPVLIPPQRAGRQLPAGPHLGQGAGDLT